MKKLFLVSLFCVSQVFGAEPSPKRYQISPTEYSTTSSDDISVSEPKRKSPKTIQIIEGPKVARPTYMTFRDKIREMKGYDFNFEHFVAALQSTFIPSDKHLLLVSLRAQNYANVRKLLQETKFLKVDSEVLDVIRGMQDQTLEQLLVEVPELLAHDLTYELIVPELITNEDSPLRQILLDNYAEVATHLPAIKRTFGANSEGYFALLSFFIENFEVGGLINLKAFDRIAAEFVQLCREDEDLNERLNDIDWPSIDDNVVERIFLAAVRGGLVSLVDFFMENFAFEVDEDFYYGALKGNPLMLVGNDLEMLDLLLAYDFPINLTLKIQSYKGDYERSMLTHLWLTATEAMKDRLRQEEYKLWTLKRAHREAHRYNITDLSEFIQGELAGFDDVLDVFGDYEPEANSNESKSSSETDSSTTEEDEQQFAWESDLASEIRECDKLSKMSGFIDEGDK